jgi:hypothetical protein
VIDPVTLTIQPAGAVLGGANNAAHLVDAELPGYAALAEQVAAAESASVTDVGAPTARWCPRSTTP